MVYDSNLDLSDLYHGNNCHALRTAILIESQNTAWLEFAVSLTIEQPQFRQQPTPFYTHS